MSGSESPITDEQTVNFEEQRHEEAQAWMTRVVGVKGSLANVVDIFKQCAKDADFVKRLVERAHQENAEIQQELAKCKNNLGLYRNFLILNGIDLKSGEKQGGRKIRKKRTKKKGTTNKTKNWQRTRKR